MRKAKHVPACACDKHRGGDALACAKDIAAGTKTPCGCSCHRLREVDPREPSIPSNLAVECAVSIANYCLTRFPCDTPPHPMLDVPWFAEKVQRCIEEACRIGLDLKASLKKADASIRLALALTDPGSREFKSAFPPKNAAEGQCQEIHQESVPGWRVVEAIRAALVGS